MIVFDRDGFHSPSVSEFMDEHCSIHRVHNMRYLWNFHIFSNHVDYQVMFLENNIDSLPDDVKKRIKEDLEYMLSKIK